MRITCTCLRYLNQGGVRVEQQLGGFTDDVNGVAAVDDDVDGSDDVTRNALTATDTDTSAAVDTDTFMATLGEMHAHY